MPERTDDELLELFNSIDKDASGFITADELKDYLEIGDDPVQLEMYEKITKLLENDDDGQITFEGFGFLNLKFYISKKKYLQLLKNIANF